ncbi:glycoside hydrolase family 15 protein [Rhodomicrobium lacus]|uniref:glycoside hydrolase family 15 protein n=1 Tax=Rhodomicrobium lacus TaxID=2498452 RepID=UPI000F8F43BE|nr:glycoside hydrolase family 15 protein [Rhodomicrobium lacus]
MANLDLGLIGNCNISALVDKNARIVWCCLPRFDGDPVFHQLLGSESGNPDDGAFTIEMPGLKSTEQFYVPNTAILKTVLHAESGSVEVTDFIPRFYKRNRPFRPKTLIRTVTVKDGSPRIRVRIKPRFRYGAVQPQITSGSNHIRFVGPDMTTRVTTDAPVDYVLEETVFNLTEPIHFVMGPDETLTDSPFNIARDFEEQTTVYWKNWSGRLALQPEWQEAVIRAAITLKLCSYEPTGAIVAAMTTSIPEAPGTGRNWDYRYCWVRDAYFVIRALTSLSAGRTLENYYRWIMNIVASSDGHIQPVYGIALEKDLFESTAASLPGFQSKSGVDNRPVRVGNQAYEHFQHDTYGNLILGAAQAFIDKRLLTRAGVDDFRRLEHVGEQAFKLYDVPDAGIWELRNRARVHTSSSVMCWAACDRLAKLASYVGEHDRVAFWRERAELIRHKIVTCAWSDKRKAFVESFGGEHLDASVLLMGELGFIDGQDPRFLSTVTQLEKVLGRGPFMMRYEAADDFGLPETAFNICAFWRLDALARTGKREEAREIFQSLLNARNHLGLMSEDTDPVTGAAWGNFPQTYSMVGIINGATRLSKPWEAFV